MIEAKEKNIDMSYNVCYNRFTTKDKGGNYMYYVAYGSNMNLRQMAHRCPNSKVVGKTVLKNWRLIFNVHLDIIEEEGQELPVVIWDIDDRDWYRLDMYEGYPNYYIKRVVKFKIDGKKRRGVVYVMCDGCKGICPPFESYFETCKQGYIDNGIDLDCLYDALDYSWRYETPHNQYNRLDGKITGKESKTS